MRYTDRIYGEIEISEPLVLELTECPTIQRLKEIDQAGYKPLWVKPDVEVGKYDHSRFAHSLGVYVLLYKYNTSLEEQIAGLIHDVSHSAFSHCVDYVLDAGSEKKHTHQDDIFAEFVKKSEIPEILKKYNLDLDYILDDENFLLKEKELPDLCADRIDYSLRTAVIFGESDIDGINYFLDNLVTENNHWLFKNFESAKKYAELFLKLNIKYYSGMHSAVMFRTVGDYLKHALNKNYISENDLYTTDKLVLSKIGNYLEKDEKLKLLFNRMNNKVEFKNDPNDYDAQVFCKSRVVDPLCSYNGEIKRVSEIDTSWKVTLENKLKPKEYFIKFEK